MLQVVGDQTKAAESQSETIASELEEMAAKIRSGERRATHACLVLADTSDVETLDYALMYWGRAMICLPLLNLAQDNIKDDIFG